MSFYLWNDFRWIFQPSKDAPALWAAQKTYEEKHRAPEVRADEEMDVGV